MNKIYLLLRDNKQAGPFSLEEIIQKELKPFDLVWVEGKSAGWRYPSEIDTLKLYVAESVRSNEQPALQTVHSFTTIEAIQENKSTISASVQKGKHIYISMPGANNIAIKPVASNVTLNENKFPSNEVAFTGVDANENEKQSSLKNLQQLKIKRTLEEVESDYTNWVFKKKTGNKIGFHKNDLITVIAVIFILTAGYYGIKNFTSSVNQDDVTTANKTSIALTSLKKNEIKSPEVKPNIVDNLPGNAQDLPENNYNLTQLNKFADKKSVNKLNNNKKRFVSPKIAPNAKVKTKGEPALSLTDREKTVQTENSQRSTVNEPIKTENNNKTGNNKKRNFSETINGFFAKFKKKKGTGVTKQPEIQIQQQANNSTRNSIHRSETDNSSVQVENIPHQNEILPSTDLMEITTNTHANDWQMGIYDLKITLHNHNNITIRNAMVTVFYYDENNRLLEKRSLMFNNIQAKSFQTQKAPDQRYADHTEYSIEYVK